MNGELSEEFSPSRGLRQGNPLSPFMFLFVVDGLSRLLKNVVNKGELRELKIARSARGISHLLFADDITLFFEANGQQASVVNKAIQVFVRSTGQLVSHEKCSLLFNYVCPVSRMEEVKEVLSVQNCTFEEKYLGLPTLEGRMKAEKFQPINDRFNKRLSDWNERYMAMAAKEVLIKSVAQALPTYTMSVFKMPMSFHDDYMKLMRCFFWGEEQGQRRVHWASWECLIKPKSQGGIGFRDTVCFNQALLARQAWRLIQSPESLCARLFKARYYPNGNVLDTVFSGEASQAWRGIEFGLELLRKGVIWRIGNGNCIRIGGTIGFLQNRP